jgi:K+ transporter
MIVWISVAILIFLFMVQRFGTDKVGYSFAPIICVWFAFIGGIGLFNFIKFDPTVIKALNPQYIVQYFQRNKKEAWVSLGGIVLAITGQNLLPYSYEILFGLLGKFVNEVQFLQLQEQKHYLLMLVTSQLSPYK